MFDTAHEKIITNIKFHTSSGIYQNFSDLCTDGDNWKLPNVHQKITHKQDMTHRP